MKENTKYNDYRFVGKIDVDEIQPWFDFASNKPWDESEIPWVVENKVRREILIKLSDGPKTFQELFDSINFSPKPLLVSKEEHDCKVKFQWTKKTIENHLLNLEWNDLIKFNGEKYDLLFPIYKMDNIEKLEQFIDKAAVNWLKVVKEMKFEVDKSITNFGDKTTLQALMIEKTVERFYELLKSEGALPQNPNIKTLWAEQLRNIKFEDWVNRNF